MAYGTWRTGRSCGFGPSVFPCRTNGVSRRGAPKFQCKVPHWGRYAAAGVIVRWYRERLVHRLRGRGGSACGGGTQELDGCVGEGRSASGEVLVAGCRFFTRARHVGARLPHPLDVPGMRRWPECRSSMAPFATRNDSEIHECRGRCINRRARNNVELSVEVD